jgi:hypothetical protein
MDHQAATVDSLRMTILFNTTRIGDDVILIPIDRNETGPAPIAEAGPVHRPA